MHYVEVFYLAFPRFTGKSCSYSTLDAAGREQLDAALATATEVAERLNKDGRFDATPEEIKKAFDRSHK